MTDREPRRRGRLRLELVVAGFALLAGLLLLHLGGALRNESAAEHAERLTSEYGIRVAFGDPRTFFVPPYGPRDARLAYVELTAADPTCAAIALGAVERALRQYPAGFVAKLIGGVFLAGDLRVGGADAGGTVGPAWIVLAAPADLGEEGIRATSFIGVHHELSSFVFHRRPEVAKRWAEFTPAGWNYTHDPKLVIAAGTGTDPPPNTGFLSAYGASNEENDFNVYAEKIFTEPQAVARLGRSHELIRRKVDFVRSEYVSVDPRMAEVFLALRLR